ncbi:MAG: hypothetical protein V4584_16860 [Verrucomicrobiota bacterium]
MTPSPLPLLTLAFLAAAVIGWKLEGDSTPPPTAPAPPHSHRPGPARQAGNVTGPRAEAARRMHFLRQIRHPGERMRATMDLATSISPADFAAWIDGGWFSLREGMDLTLFTKILMQRWRNEDPESFLLWSYSNNSPEADSLRQSWAEAEPQRLLDFYRQHPNTFWEVLDLAVIAENHPALALQRLQEMISAGLSRDEFDCTPRLLKVLAKQNPAALEAALDFLPELERRLAEAIIITGKLESSFSTAVRELWDRPDGLGLFRYSLSNSGDPALLTQLFAGFADFPDSWRQSICSNAKSFLHPGNASVWLSTDLVSLGFSEEMEKLIRPDAITDLSYHQPADALAFLMTTGLDPVKRETVLFKIFENAARNPQQAQALLATLTSEEDREIARKAMQPGASEPETSRIDNPSDWMQAVTAANSEDGKFSDYLSMIHDWDSGKITALKTQFQALPEDKQRKLTLFLLGSSSAPALLEEEALATLIRQPWDAQQFIPADPFAEPFQATNEEIKARLASEYVGKVAAKDPTAAGEWISTLPDGQPKLWAQKNLLSLWSQYDPEAAGRWMKTLPAGTEAKLKDLRPKPRE